MRAINTQVGQRIRSLRMSRNLTLDELADRAKMSTKHLGKVERGTVNPSVQCIADIASALKLPVASIMEADHERSKEELIAEIVGLAPELSLKDAQIVYRLIAMLTNR